MIIFWKLKYKTKDLLNDILVVACIILVAGCNNTIDPLNEEKQSYSIYGYLALHREVNYIRVKDLNQPLSKETTKNLDATVTLKNIENNRTVTLQDSIIEFDGVYTHNFYTSLNIKPETSYQIAVEGSNDKSITATAVTPRVAQVQAEPTDEDCNTPVKITFNPVIDRHSLEVSVGFDYRNERHWATSTVESGEGEKVHVRFKPLSILESVFPPDRLTGEVKVRCHELDHNNLFVRYTQYGPGFFEDAKTDSSVDPNSTIRFGGLNKDTFSFPIDTARIED